MKLSHRVAIVTGGGQGIGEGIVKCLAQEGTDVIVVDMNGVNAQKVADGVKALGRKSLAIEANLSDSNLVKKTIEQTLRFSGRIDILVNNVGGHSAAPPRSKPASFTDRGDAEWQGYYEQNLKAAVSMTREVIPYMKKQHSGKIVNISSDAARSADSVLVPYSVFKAGIITLTLCLARELAIDNINVNCICPGWVYSPLVERGAIAMYNAVKNGMELPARYKDILPADFDIDKSTIHELWQKTVIALGVPLQREQTPEDIGLATVFLVSEDARNITGQTLAVDGGLVIR